MQVNIHARHGFYALRKRGIPNRLATVKSSMALPPLNCHGIRRRFRSLPVFPIGVGGAIGIDAEAVDACRYGRKRNPLRLPAVQRDAAQSSAAKRVPPFLHPTFARIPVLELHKRTDRDFGPRRTDASWTAHICGKSDRIRAAVGEPGRSQRIAALVFLHDKFQGTVPNIGALG
ncbi:MAG TPA: hypothetical protein VGM03_17110, partial [Phycisphaerae bacterium]